MLVASHSESRSVYQKIAIEAAQKAFYEAFKVAEHESDQKLKKAKKNKRKKLAAMQGDFERLSLLHQVYHKAPDDVFELIVSKYCRLDAVNLMRPQCLQAGQQETQASR